MFVKTAFAVLTIAKVAEILLLDMSVWLKCD